MANLTGWEIAACILAMLWIGTIGITRIQLHAYKEVLTAIIRLTYVMLNMSKVVRYPSVTKKDREDYDKYFLRFMEAIDDLERIIDPDALLETAKRIDVIRYNATNAGGLNTRLSVHAKLREEKKDGVALGKTWLERLMDKTYEDISREPSEELSAKLQEARSKYCEAMRLQKLPDAEIDWFLVEKSLREGISFLEQKQGPRMT